MASLPSKRIIKEFQELKNSPLEGVEVTAVNDDIRHLEIKMIGAKDTPYEGGKFIVEMYLSNNYPMDPPKVMFNTNIFHPNIDKLGKICLDILKDKWSPAIKIRSVVLSIYALLSTPNPDDPLDNEAADMWKKDHSKALAKAKEYTKKYACV